MTPIPTIYHANPQVMGAAINMVKEHASVYMGLEIAGAILTILFLLLSKWTRKFFRHLFH